MQLICALIAFIDATISAGESSVIEIYFAWSVGPIATQESEYFLRDCNCKHHKKCVETIVCVIRTLLHVKEKVRARGGGVSQHMGCSQKLNKFRIIIQANK